MPTTANNDDDHDDDVNYHHRHLLLLHREEILRSVSESLSPFRGRARLRARLPTIHSVTVLLVAAFAFGMVDEAQPSRVCSFFQIQFAVLVGASWLCARVCCGAGGGGRAGLSPAPAGTMATLTPTSAFCDASDGWMAAAAAVLACAMMVARLFCVGCCDGGQRGSEVCARELSHVGRPAHLLRCCA
jgi:hypothetical protein